MSDKQNKDLDILVEKLYKQLDEKKKNVSKLDHPTFTTPIGNFKWDEQQAQTENLNTYKIERLIKAKAHLMAKEYWYAEALKGMADIKPVDFTHQEYSLKQWIEDIDTIINRMNINKLKSDITKLEQRLSGLVSPEMKRQRELEQLANDIESV